MWWSLIRSVSVFSSLLIINKTQRQLQVFNYIGKYSNIIEKTRAAEIALNIQQQKDLGCQAIEVITINDDKLTCSRNQVQKFWSYLGVFDSERLNGMFFLFLQCTRHYFCISLHVHQWYIIIISLQLSRPAIPTKTNCMNLPLSIQI